MDFRSYDCFFCLEILRMKAFEYFLGLLVSIESMTIFFFFFYGPNVSRKAVVDFLIQRHTDGCCSTCSPPALPKLFLQDSAIPFVELLKIPMNPFL